MARQKGRDVTGIPCDGKRFFCGGIVNESRFQDSAKSGNQSPKELTVTINLLAPLQGVCIMTHEISLAYSCHSDFESLLLQ